MHHGQNVKKQGGSKKLNLSKKRKLNENKGEIITFAEIGGTFRIFWN